MSARPACVLLLVAASFGLSACGGARSGRARAAPGDALNAGGEPQWSAQLRTGTLRFTTADGVDVAVRTTMEDHGRDGAVWSGALPAAQSRPAAPLRLIVSTKPCQDAATGMTYPLTASVEAAGKRYAGCAAPTRPGPRSAHLAGRMRERLLRA